MTARQTLESYGTMLSKCAALVDERKACLARARRDAANAPAWERRALRLKGEHLRLQRAAARRLKEITALLDRMDDQAVGAVLSLRYLSLMPYAGISEALGFSERHIYRLHLRGVACLQALLDGQRVPGAGKPD